MKPSINNNGIRTPPISRLRSFFNRSCPVYLDILLAISNPPKNPMKPSINNNGIRTPPISRNTP